jgi:E3 SUMO-protein ligase RanBP2
VFSRIGTKDTSLLAATLQQPTVITNAPTPINDVESASEALRRAAAGYSASSTVPAPHAYQINVPTQASPEKIVDTTLSPAIQLSTRSLLANIPEPEFSSVTTPDKSKSARDRKASSCSDGSYAPEEEIDNYPDFKPIIPLPEEVEVKTGEEGEDVLFDQRAKLFRFAESQWKERGVGQLRLLQDPTTKKVRLLMRRDQVSMIPSIYSIAGLIIGWICSLGLQDLCQPLHNGRHKNNRNEYFSQFLDLGRYGFCRWRSKTGKVRG